MAELLRPALRLLILTVPQVLSSALRSLNVAPHLPDVGRGDGLNGERSPLNSANRRGKCGQHKLGLQPVLRVLRNLRIEGVGNHRYE